MLIANCSCSLAGWTGSWWSCSPLQCSPFCRLRAPWSSQGSSLRWSTIIGFLLTIIGWKEESEALSQSTHGWGTWEAFSQKYKKVRKKRQREKVRSHTTKIKKNNNYSLNWCMVQLLNFNFLTFRLVVNFYIFFYLQQSFCSIVTGCILRVREQLRQMTSRWKMYTLSQKGMIKNNMSAIAILWQRILCVHDASSWHWNFPRGNWTISESILDMKRY